MLTESEFALFKRDFGESYLYYIFCYRGVWIVSSIVLLLVLAPACVLALFYLSEDYMSVNFNLLIFMMLDGLWTAYLAGYVLPNLAFGCGMFMAVHGEFKSLFPTSSHTKVEIDRKGMYLSHGHLTLAYNLSFGARWFSLLWFVDPRRYKSLIYSAYDDSYFDSIAYIKD